MDKFVDKKYKLIRSENLEELLAEIGAVPVKQFAIIVDIEKLIEFMFNRSMKVTKLRHVEEELEETNEKKNSFLTSITLIF